MMATINPLGERARGNRWWRTATALVAGCLLGGVALGAAGGGAGWVAGRVGTLPAGAAAVLVAAAVATAGVVELAGWVVPTRRRQVDEAWVGRYRGWVYGAGFGVQLGAGLATTVTTVAVYATVAVVVVLGAAGEVGGAAVAGALFGLGRALPVVAGWGLHDPALLRSRLGRMTAAAGVSRVATGASLCALGAGAVSGLVA